MKNKFKKLSLKGKIVSLVLSAFIILITVLLVTVIEINKSIANENIEQKVITDMKEKTEIKANRIETWVENTEKSLTLFSKAKIIRDTLNDIDNQENLNNLQNYTNNFYKELKNWEGLYTDNLETKVIIHTSTKMNGFVMRPDPAKAKPLIDALKKGFYNTGVMVSPTSSTLVLSMYAPINNPNNNNLIGFVGGAVSVSEINDLLDEKDNDDVSYTMVNLNKNEYIYNDDQTLLAQPVEDEELLGIINSLDKSTEDCNILKNSNYIITYKYMPKHNWLILSNAKLNIDNEVATSVSMIIKYIPLMLVLVMIIAIISIYFLLKIIKTNLTLKITDTARLLANASGQVEKITSQISGNGLSFANDSQSQASHIEEVSSSVEETTSMIAQTSEGASETSKLSEKLSSAVGEGNQKMENMISTINDIKISSDEIGKIIKIIDDIASQTNILALNAAVEAARAGDAGKGFAVVAEEVRNLAQKSAESAKNSSSIIEKNVELSENGVRVANEVFESLKAINEDVEKVKAIAKESANATIEESRGMEQISESIKSIETKTMGIADKAQENVEYSNSLKNEIGAVSNAIKELKEIIGMK